MEILIFLLVSYVLLSVTLYLLFEKAGVEGWKGLVPGLNFVVWCELIGRKSSYALLLLIPIVNIFIYVGMCIELGRSFGKYELWHSALALIYAPALFFLIAQNKEDKYLGKAVQMESEYMEKIEEAKAANKTRTLKKLTQNNPYQKSAFREWLEAIVFAVFAAAFIRMFLIEAYTIPTSSMEGSLMVGDFLFVSKANYGIRTPKTILMVPLLHNRIPGLGAESYIEQPDLPFYRLPAIEEIDRNEAVVFNFPEGDSVYIRPERTYSINDVRRNPQLAKQLRNEKLVTRPLDKKDHYIKRCIGLPGDSLQIIDKQVYINGSAIQNPTNIQYTYLIVSPNGPINTSKFTEWGITLHEDVRGRVDEGMVVIMNEEQKQKVQAMDPAITIEYFDVTLFNNNPLSLFPSDPNHNYGWTVDNFGPIYIPQKGATVALTEKSIAFYRRIISNYEGNELVENANGTFTINGQAATTYTFQQDYYWMMGDNRHNSEDSRVWGFAPADHVVGKPLFIWFSTKEGSIRKGINWGRIFKSANKM